MAQRQIKINDQDDIAGMRHVGKLAADQLTALLNSDMLEPKTPASVLDAFCARMSKEQGCTAAPLGYCGPSPGGMPPYPASICVSPNHVMCHGIPSDNMVLQKGDIANVDVTLINKDGYHGDTSVMIQIGKVKPFMQNLCTITQEAMYAGIKAVKPGENFNEIGRAIENSLAGSHATVVRKFVGHGIGKVFHDEPQILPYYEPLIQRTMEPGMIFTIEPIVTHGDIRRTSVLKDGWTIKATDRKPSAQWEHTVLVTETGYEILTFREGEKITPIT